MVTVAEVPLIGGDRPAKALGGAGEMDGVAEASCIEGEVSLWVRCYISGFYDGVTTTYVGLDNKLYVIRTCIGVNVRWVL